jgi:hypothetical protein
MIPDAAMMAAVDAIMEFMVTLDDARIENAFTDDPVIVENFAPYVFRGPSAVARWREGFRRHAATLSELKSRFGRAQDFSRTGDTVYFVLPTIWTGRTAEKPFEEHGGWSFVLEQRGEGWQVACYAWAVTAFRLV